MIEVNRVWSKMRLGKVFSMISLLIYIAFVYWRMFFYAYGNVHRMQFGEIKYNLIPFKTIIELFSGQYGFIAWGYNLFGNIAIFIPVGFLEQLVINDKKRMYKTLIISLLIILFAESMQLILRLGVFDVDDILLNLVGCCIGSLVYKWKNIFAKNE